MSFVLLAPLMLQAQQVDPFFDEDNYFAHPIEGAQTNLLRILDEAEEGAVITFSPLLSGKTIHLTTPVVIDKSVTIDASALPDGITINAAAVSNLYATGRKKARAITSPREATCARGKLRGPLHH